MNSKWFNDKNILEGHEEWESYDRILIETSGFYGLLLVCEQGSTYEGIQQHWLATFRVLKVGSTALS